MHIQFTPSPVPGLLACDWCGGVAVKAAEHARWHWRNEGRSAGDASATGPSYGVGEPLTVTVDVPRPAMYGDDTRTAGQALADAAPGHGGTLTDEQAAAHGLLPDIGQSALTVNEITRGLTGGHPFPAPVHVVPRDPGRPLSRDRLREAENRAVSKHGGAATQAHVWEELRLIEEEEDTDATREAEQRDTE